MKKIILTTLLALGLMAGVTAQAQAPACTNRGDLEIGRAHV